MSTISEIVRVETDLSLESLIYRLGEQLSEEEIIEFVKDLDKCISSWEFTKLLYQYFKAEIDKLDEEEDETERPAINWEQFKDHCNYLEFGDCIYNEDPDNMPPCKQDTCPMRDSEGK